MGFLDKLFDNYEDDPKNYLEQGKVLILNGDLDEGIKLLRKAIGLFPHITLRIKKAIGLYPHITHRIYKIAYKLHAGAESKNKAVGGNIYYSDGLVELEAAIAIMELLSEFESNKAEIWFKLGVLYDNHCYFDKAVKGYERAAKLDPEGPDGAEAQNNLGILYFNKERDILGIKGEEASGYHAFSMNNDDFINTDK
jgi:tetratricopeptide (TPR) repeat protein